MVEVSNKHKSITVGVSSNNGNTIVTAKSDTSQYWANQSHTFADQSKEYAQESKHYAELANSYIEGFENVVTNNTNNIIATSNDCINQLNTTKEEAIENITNIKSESIASVEAKGNEIVSVVNEGIAEINSTKTTILNDIEFVADGEKKEIEELAENAKDDIKSTGFYMRDDKLYFINSKGEEEEFKSGGGGGLEIGDIGFTQMTIDETKGKRRILNGQLIIQEQYVQFANIIKNSVALNPDLACTEEEWQTAVTMNTFGLCGKFVIDDEGGTIRLPKYPNYFIAGLANIASVVGNGMTLGLIGNEGRTAGLANNQGVNLGSMLFPIRESYGLEAGTPVTSGNAIGYSTFGITTDPTKSGIEAQINEKQIAGTYFIQVATGAETEDNIINEIELNNPFSLLDYKFSEYKLNNISWLRSEGQYNSKAIYPTVYDLLLKIYNGTETKTGVSVKLATEIFTDYDFVLNTAEETFRLPVKVKLASGKAVVGNGMTLGFTDGISSHNGGSMAWYSGELRGNYSQQNLPVGSSLVIDSSKYFNSNALLGVTTDPTKSGIETSDSDLYLYFYVGETVQNANLINAGRIEEHLHSLIPDNSSLIAGYAMPSSKYIDLTLGASGTTYTAPANGWVQVIGTTSSTVSDYTLENVTSGIQTYKWTGANNQRIRGYIPCEKGDTIRLYYYAATITNFRFIYAQGEV